MLGPEFYDEGYFEHSVLTGKRSPVPYIWRPEVTVPLAAAILDMTGLKPGQPFLDWGCAKGYLVRVLRWMHREAWGCDWSEYAVASAPDDAKPYLALCKSGADIPFAQDFHLILAKDVLEHQSEENLETVLSLFRAKTQSLLVIVPLGDGEDHVIPELDAQPSHVLKQPLDWWADRLDRVGFCVIRSWYRYPGIKERWRHYPKGSGILYVQ